MRENKISRLLNHGIKILKSNLSIIRFYLELENKKLKLKQNSLRH